MPPETVLETNCPACSRPFEVQIGQLEGTCPHCGTRLQFEAQDVAAEAPPTDEEATSHEERRPAPVAPPRIGEFRVHCPACSGDLNVAMEATQAMCPHCQSQLVLEDEFAERGMEFPVQCPACSRTHEVPLEAQTGRCPHCGTLLSYADVPYTAPDLMPTAREAEPEALEPAQPPAQATTAAGPESEPMAAAPSASHGSPLVQTEPEGMPIPVECPSCKKPFGVPPGTSEGACPHCSVPLAFVTDREHEALRLAEERKKKLQQKLAERRQRLKEPQAAKSPSTPSEAGPSRWSRLLRRSPKEALPKPEEKTPQAAPSPPAQNETASKGKAKASAATAPTKAQPPPAPGPVEVELGSIDVDSSKVPDERPAPSKGSRLFAWRKKTEPVPPRAAVAVEADIEMAPVPTPSSKKPRQKPRPPAVSAAVEAAIEIAAPPTAATKAPKKKPSTPASETMEVAIDVSADAAVAPPEPKKGLFGRFRKSSNSPPNGSAATVEEAEISISGVEPTAAPRADRAKAPKPELAVVEGGDFVLEEAPSAPETEISIDLGPADEAPAKKSRKR